MVECTASGKSLTVSPFFPFSQMTTSKVSMALLGRTFPTSKRSTLHDFAFPSKKHQSKEFLKRPDPLLSGNGSWSQYERVVPS